MDMVDLELSTVFAACFQSPSNYKLQIYLCFMNAKRATLV